MTQILEDHSAIKDGEDLGVFLSVSSVKSVVMRFETWQVPMVMFEVPRYPVIPGRLHRVGSLTSCINGIWRLVTMQLAWRAG
jgi:hypothetical protein